MYRWLRSIQKRTFWCNRRGATAARWLFLSMYSPLKIGHAFAFHWLLYRLLLNIIRAHFARIAYFACLIFSLLRVNSSMRVPSPSRTHFVVHIIRAHFARIAYFAYLASYLVLRHQCVFFRPAPVSLPAKKNVGVYVTTSLSPCQTGCSRLSQVWKSCKFFGVLPRPVFNECTLCIPT